MFKFNGLEFSLIVRPVPRPKLVFSPTSVRRVAVPSRTLKGLTVQYQLKGDTAVTFAFAAADEWGNPTTDGVGTPTVTSISDPTILTAVIDATNSLVVTPLGKLGTTQIAVAAGATGELKGELDVTVVPGAAVSITFIPGTTTPVVVPPAPVPPPTPPAPSA